MIHSVIFNTCPSAALVLRPPHMLVDIILTDCGALGNRMFLFRWVVWYPGIFMNHPQRYLQNMFKCRCGLVELSSPEELSGLEELSSPEELLSPEELSSPENRRS